MGAEDNIKTIQRAYDALGRGDIEAIVAVVTDDVDWAAEASSTAVPWYGPRTGKDGVADYFMQHVSSVEILEFTPTAYGANETDVFSIVHLRTSNLATGKQTDQNLHHHFRFRGDKICYFRGAEDSAQTEASFR